jgi:hypothetical protein
MYEKYELMGEFGPPLITRIRRVRQRQMIYLISIRQNRFREVGIIEGSKGEPRHKKRPNRVDWAFILPVVY